MRSRAVGIDKRQNGFVKLYIFSLFCWTFSKRFYRLRPAPSQAGGCLVITRSELCQWKLIGCYHFVMFITYNQLMWVFKVLFGYDCTPNKSVQPLFGSTNTDCTGQTHRQTCHKGKKQKKLLLLDFLSIPTRSPAWRYRASSRAPARRSWEMWYWYFAISASWGSMFFSVIFVGFHLNAQAHCP